MQQAKASYFRLYAIFKSLYIKEPPPTAIGRDSESNQFQETCKES